jgi:hypothetical protein
MINNRTYMASELLRTFCIRKIMARKQVWTGATSMSTLLRERIRCEHKIVSRHSVSPHIVMDVMCVVCLRRRRKEGRKEGREGRKEGREGEQLVYAVSLHANAAASDARRLREGSLFS